MKRLICVFKGHDWEDIPDECLKEEYHLDVTGGKFCLRCKKPELIKKQKKTDRDKKVASIFSDYLYWKTPPYPRRGTCRAPAPWHRPPIIKPKRD